jgi:formate dehydrogenase major subunit
VSPLHNGETLDISPEDAARLGIDDGDLVQIESRRGKVEAPARIDQALRAGMVFMTLHFPDEVPTNLLTIDVSDPKSGTAEFKACAVRVMRVAPRAKPPGQSTTRVTRTSVASEPRERSGDRGAPASERAGGAGGAKPPGR